MKKKLLSIFLVGVLTLSCLTGCQPWPPKDIEKPVTQEEPTQKEDEKPEDTPTEVNKEAIGFSEFDSGLITYLNQSKSEDNYMVSPLSLKMALALLAAGAETNTLDEILDATGFETRDDYLVWANLMSTLEFEEKNEYQDSAFSIGYGIWHNSDKPGEFKEAYKENLKELNIMFDEVPGDKLHEEINNWVDKKTKGLIPNLINQPIPDAINVLVNTIYLKGNWYLQFDEYNTKEGDFTTINDEVVQKKLMNQTEDFLYYDDENCQVLIMSMDNGFKTAFVLGENTNIKQKIQAAERTLVNVTLPKFEIETSMEEEISAYLKESGMVKAFDMVQANFNAMFDVPTHVDKIIQKTKISLDEKGAEAAAATAIIMKDNAVILEEEPPKPIDFIANKPFTFYIYSDSQELTEPELIFYGQYVE